MNGTLFIMIMLGFLSGSIMYSYLIPRYVKRIDPRKDAYDKNPGGSNAMKSCGTAIGLICILLDIAKAFVPVFVYRNLMKIEGYVIPIAAAPILGHAFSPFLGFRGGKAVASTYGALLALLPECNAAVILAIIMLLFKFIIIIKPNSSATTASMILLNIIMYVFNSNAFYKGAVLIISAVVVLKHLLHPDEGETTAALFGRFFKFTIHDDISNKKNG